MGGEKREEKEKEEELPKKTLSPLPLPSVEWQKIFIKERRRRGKKKRREPRKKRRIVLSAKVLIK